MVGFINANSGLNWILQLFNRLLRINIRLEGSIVYRFEDSIVYIRLEESFVYRFDLHSGPNPVHFMAGMWRGC